MAKSRTVRTAKQKAALRKAQLASARKRKGKGKGSRVRRMLLPKTRSKSAAQTRRRRIGYAALSVGGFAVAGMGIASSYRNYRKAVNWKPPQTNWAATNNRIRLDNAFNQAMRTMRRTDTSVASAMRRAGIPNAAKARRRSRRNDRYARVSQKVSGIGMYNSGLSANVGGRAFVAGRGGTYRR
jgi:hypothetical protein